MKALTLIIISSLTILAIFCMPVISQDSAYHDFADQVDILGIPNFFNVISNIPFLLSGFIGFHFILVNKPIIQESKIRGLYQFFFVAVFLVGCGSAFYHLSPDNSTLIWDRLPMSLAFVTFFIIILGEYINEKLALKLFLPFLLLGVFSVLYWYWSELMGQGDLRFYVVVQFLPLVLIPVIMMLYTSRFRKPCYLWVLLGCYLLAKVFELTDDSIYQLTTHISGHTVKHLVSASAPFMLYLLLKDLKRQDSFI